MSTEAEELKAEQQADPRVEPSHAKTPEELDLEVRRIMGGRTRRSFLTGGAAALAGYVAYRAIAHAPQIGQLQAPLRKAMEFNRDVSRAVFGDHPHSATFSPDRAINMRINGSFGQDPKMKLNTWRLQVVGLDHPEKHRQYIEDVDLWTYETGADNPDDDQPEAPSAKQAPGDAAQAMKVAPGQTPLPGNTPTLGPNGRYQLNQTVDLDIPIPKAPESDTTRTPGVVLSLENIKALPSYEQVTEFKCIEGWSQITSWRGARFSDFVKAFPPAGRPKYVMMETADGIYTCGFDFESLMDAQTLLCYEMHSRPLTMGHGAPLRLAMPIKYGYKQIKQVAKITYTNTRTVDYWENLGYDWYAGF